MPPGEGVLVATVRGGGGGCGCGCGCGSGGGGSANGCGRGGGGRYNLYNGVAGILTPPPSPTYPDRCVTLDSSLILTRCRSFLWSAEGPRLSP